MSVGGEALRYNGGGYRFINAIGRGGQGISDGRWLPG